MQHVIGIDIGGTKINGGIIGADGTIIAPYTHPTPQDHADAVVATVIDLCQRLYNEGQERDLTIERVGIGTAGMVNTATGEIVYANSNLPGWTGVRLGERVREGTGLAVIVDNDVNVLALSEGRLGIAREYDHILYLTVGTGIGGAIVQNGRIWRGAHFSAGEIGYLIAGRDTDGTPVNVEACASGKGIERLYTAKTGKAHDLRDIAQSAQAGDDLARTIIAEGARLLGDVLGPVVCLLDPQIVVIGGGVPEIGDLWWHPFERTVRGYALPATEKVVLAQASLRTHAGLIGAGLLAMDM